MNMAPKLTYFCELPAEPLQQLFDDPAVIDFLAATQAGVSLGILDFSAERAGVVHRLNQAGVPVSAWLLLPKDQGYWFNLDNAPEAAERYNQFIGWTAQNELHWERIGVDIEPDMRAIQLLITQRSEGIRQLLANAVNTPRLVNGTRAYQQLVEQIHADGYAVEAYHIPFIVDERKAGSKLLPRLFGLVDVPGIDLEVFMLYSSFLRPWGDGALWNYAPYAGGIGIGSTGGGVDVGGADKIRPLNWAELQTDLLLASRHSENLYIFSLEGCVQQGFLPQLHDINWQQTVEIPYEAAQKVEDMRRKAGRVLWLMARPAVMLFGAAILVSAIALVTRRHDR
jgi:hypothetical protein